MVTVLFNNGAKTFKQDPKDSWGLCDYDYLVNYLEAWILKRNENLDMFYNHKVKTFARKLMNSDHMVKDFADNM